MTMKTVPLDATGHLQHKTTWLRLGDIVGLPDIYKHRKAAKMKKKHVSNKIRGKKLETKN